MGIKLDKDTLAVEQSNYLTKIVNVYVAYDLDARAKISLRNFKVGGVLASTMIEILSFLVQHLFVNGK